MKIRQAARTAATIIAFSCWSTVAHADIQPYMAEAVKPYTAEPVAPRNADSVKVETIAYSDGSKYTGETLNGKMHGKGVFYYADGTVYDGMFRAGFPEGTGVTTWPDGRKYSGQFKSGKIEGHGTLVTKDGSYTGPFQAGAMHGTGIAAINGKRYEVTYENGKLISSVPLDAAPTVSSGTVQPRQAEAVQPRQADAVQPRQAEAVQPRQADAVQPRQADAVQPYKAEPYHFEVVLQLDSVNAYYRLNQFDLPAPPKFIGDAVMIPLDLAVDKLNATAQWNDTWDVVTITFHNKQSAVLKFGEPTAIVNGTSLAMAAAPAMIDNYAYIPLHLLSDVADQDIYYVWETGQISLNIPPGQIPDFIENSKPGNFYYEPDTTPSSSTTNGDGDSSNKPVFDLKDGLQWQEGFWNYSNMFPNWGALFNP